VQSEGVPRGSFFFLWAGGGGLAVYKGVAWLAW